MLMKMVISVCRLILLAAIIASFTQSSARAYTGELTTAEEDYLKQKEPIVFVSQTHYPPFEFVGADGNHTGMCIDLVRWIATEFGFQVHFTDTSFRQAQEAVLSGRAHILTSLFRSKKRDEVFDFTKVMFDVPASIFVIADRPDIKSKKDLRGKTVAMQAGDYAEEFLKSNDIQCSFSYTKNFAEATDLVIAGQADAIIGDEQIVLYHIYSNKLTDRIKKVGAPLYIGKNCMGTRDPNPVLVGIMNKGIDLAIKNGVLDQINRKWVGTHYSPPPTLFHQVYPFLMALIGGIFLAAAIGWFWNFELRKLVATRTAELNHYAEKLHKNEERYKFLAENMGDIVWTLDLDLVTTYVSPSIEKILGFTPAERKKHTLAEMITPESMERVTAALLEELEHDNLPGTDPQRLITVEAEYYHRNGSKVWMENRVKALRDDTGAVIGMYGVSRDITERKQAEEKIVRAGKEWERTFDSVSDLIAILDSEHRIVRTNKAMAEKLGAPPQGAVGKTCCRSVHGMDAPPAFCPHKQLLKDGRSHTAEIFEERLGGYFLVTVTPLFDSAGQLTGSVHIARDITAQKQADAAIRASEEKFRAIFNQAAVGVSLTDTRTGALLQANRKYCEITGYSQDELNKLTFQEFSHPEDLRYDLEKMQELKAGKISHYSMEKRYLRPDGITVWVTLTVSPMGFAEEEPFSHIAVIEDISEKKQLEHLMAIQRDLGVALGHTGDLDEALDICLEAALKVEDVDYGGIYLVDTQTGGLNLRAHKNLPPEFVTVASHFEKQAPQARIIAEGGTRCQSYQSLLEELDLDPAIIKERLSFDLEALTFIPIRHEGKSIGSLNVASKSLSDFSEFDRYSLEALTVQIAGALARIFADHSLKASQHNLQTLFESLDDFLFILDASGKIIGFNPVVEKRLGYTAEQLRNMHVLDVHPPGRREEAAEIVQQMLQGQATFCPVPLVTANGSEIPVETKITRGTWNHREAIFGISRDISQRLEVEKAKRSSEERLLAAIEAIDEGFVLYDTDDRLAMYNDKYLEIYKESADVMVKGTRFEDIIRTGAERGQYPEAIGRTEEWVAERLARHRDADTTLEQKLPDGRWLKIAERKVKDGSIVGFRVDITDIKRSEERTQEALREKETLLREIHHRVKNNLQMVSSLLSLQSDQTDDQQALNAFAEAESRVHSMAIVHEILYQSDKLTEINLQYYLENLSDNIFSVFTTLSSNVTITVAAEDVTFGIEQAVPCGLIVTELLTNALKYAFPGNTTGAIRIKAAYAGDRHIELTLADNGIGLPPDFDPRQLKSLGIPLVTELVEDQLEGEWTLTRNRGACWCIRWPEP